MSGTERAGKRMNILVINGSPKGKYSITLQTVLYIQKLFPECSFEILHAGQQIKSLEKDMSKALDSINKADMILFSYPVYTFSATYQLHRFIELLKDSRTDLRGKPAAQITTSKHFFDITAHQYIEDNCKDMGLVYLGGLSADMEDLLSESGRKDAREFWKYILWKANNKEYDPSNEISAPEALPIYERKFAAVNTGAIEDSFEPEKKEKKQDFRVVIVTNKEPDDTSLGNMIDDFRAVFPYETKVVNIAQYPFSGGCLGCFNCAANGKCIYKDGFDVFLRNEIQTAAAIVYAFSIKDHSMGATFKRYDDRQFCNGHRTVTSGRPMGYIIRGNINAEPNLQMVIQGRCQVGGNFLAGEGTDADSIKRMGDSLAYALENKLTQPANFYGVGGMKIFRDLIYLMRGLMKADHQYYKKHGIYDFPQKKKGTIIKMKLVGMLMSNPKLMSKAGAKMNEGMIAPYKKVIDNA